MLPPAPIVILVVLSVINSKSLLLYAPMPALLYSRAPITISTPSSQMLRAALGSSVPNPNLSDVAL